jgi:hypothetical protein
MPALREVDHKPEIKVRKSSRCLHASLAVDHKPEIKVRKSSRCLHASARRDNFSVPATVLHASVINHYYDYVSFVADEDG